ncbi:PREDICTED: uncharacterized protein LOC104825490 [Tarenaya hassleriana]|uniref:uncharacterized protein LOC104825490 n=1 Tax=Tarenaya hassleriana TaxID=28532 RepID=UPI00053C4409|nr:PREDICTED: uncharacterized protein LOC104825490 [Tarenaya hassleriana]
MALPLGKLTLLVGAGLVGSVIAKEGLPDVSSFISGAFKIVFRQLKQEEQVKSAKKPHNDTLLAQVNSLRQELQMLASNRSITIVSTGGSGGRKYGVIIIIAVVGYGYVWWKGWKLPDFMFATRRSLSDACNSIAKQLEDVYSSISATKRHLSSRIERVDSSLDEIEGITKETGKEVTELRDGASRINDDVRSVRYVVETLESKINRIEGKQDITLKGVGTLYAQYRENIRIQEPAQGLPSNSSRPALEAAPMTPSSRTGSLPPVSPRESHSHSSSISNGSNKSSQRLLQHAQSLSGLKDVNECSGNSRDPSSDRTQTRHTEATTSNGSSATGSGSGLFGIFSAPRILRTRSAINAVPQPSHSSGPQ